ncbi:MAG: diguanylate cyclase [Hespellia sp.]|nr:diguanylate cyclase [Hespellia sp.]
MTENRNDLKHEKRKRSKRKLKKLEEENKRLFQKAQRDWLTGIYNRGATEEKINKLLKEGQKGTLFLFDVDDFKQINDVYGHICGDTVLQKIASVLKVMVAATDIVGRVGGDEFVAFITAGLDEKRIKERCCQFEKRLRENDIGDICGRISVTVCGSLCQSADDYRSLVDRADMQLLVEKKRRKKGNRHSITDSLLICQEERTAEKGFLVDLAIIHANLKEPQKPEGALYKDYETFRSIYRFMERRMSRRQESLSVVFFSLTDANGNAPSLRLRSVQVNLLHHIIQKNLRQGDLFTQYTGFQFLVMLSDADEETAEMIANRIHTKFFQEDEAIRENTLLYHSFPLRSNETLRGSFCSDEKE